jgi:hypothetical protein
VNLGLVKKSITLRLNWGVKMIANYNQDRWEQLQVNVEEECLTVYDSLAERKRVY